MRNPEYIVQRLEKSTVTTDSAMIVGKAVLLEIAEEKQFKESEGGAFADFQEHIPTLVGAAKLIEYAVTVILWYMKRHKRKPSKDEVLEKAKGDNKLPPNITESDCKVIIDEVIQSTDEQSDEIKER